MNEFKKLHIVCSTIHVYMLEDQMPETETDTYGVLQSYFHDNLFSPEYEVAIINHRNLAKNTVETILNEIFLLGKQMNEKTLETFIVNINIEFRCCVNKNLFQ